MFQENLIGLLVDSIRGVPEDELEDALGVFPEHDIVVSDDGAEIQITVKDGRYSAQATFKRD